MDDLDVHESFLTYEGALRDEVDFLLEKIEFLKRMSANGNKCVNTVSVGLVEALKKASHDLEDYPRRLANDEWKDYQKNM